MTPQTFMNDLQSERCDARSIVLCVVGKPLYPLVKRVLFNCDFLDEAHRATGDYSYNQVIRFLMAKNPHFRVLALTATPGNKPEAVQALVDSLHISHIEIRNEDSLDLRPYIHKKVRPNYILCMPYPESLVDRFINRMLLRRMKTSGNYVIHWQRLWR